MVFPVHLRKLHFFFIFLLFPPKRAKPVCLSGFFLCQAGIYPAPLQPQHQPSSRDAQGGTAGAALLISVGSFQLRVFHASGTAFFSEFPTFLS